MVIIFKSTRKEIFEWVNLGLNGEGAIWSRVDWFGLILR